MNFLAHIFLSGSNELTQVGNFVGDWVKGSLISVNAKYPPEMALGIRMHRFIDCFTDSSPIAARSIALLRPVLGKYAGVATDVIYDHFLAKNWNRYSIDSLDSFAKKFYSNCIKYYDILPKNLQPLIPHLIISNRLKSYYNIKGVEAALKIMERKTSFPTKAEETISTLKENYATVENDFNLFFDTILTKIYTEFGINNLPRTTSQTEMTQ